MLNKIELHKKLSLKVVGAIIALLLVTATAFPVLAYQGVGGSPYAADLLVSGLNTGTLDPGQEYWYAYSRLDLGDPGYSAIILSLNFEAEGVAVANRVNFQVFTFEQVEAWLRDNSGPVDSLGLGTPASTDFDVNTGERLWSGPVAASDVYYVRIFNLSPSPVQFRLTALGQKSRQFDGFMAVDPAAAPADSTDSNVIPASVSMRGQTDPAQRPSIAATLPVDTSDGSPTSTSWLLAAQAINGLPPQEAAAWLMSAAMLGWLPGNGAPANVVAVAPVDSNGNAPAAAPPAVPVDPNANAPLAAAAEGGGEPEVVAAEVAQPEAAPEPDPNLGHSIYPNRPLRLLDAPNTGRLGPKTEHWYTFTPGKVDGKLIENMSLTMFFTPGEPNIARHVTFEMFTGSQYPIWVRGTPDDMAHFGAGSWVSRDKDYITGERLWHGSVVDGDQYYVKINNDTGKTIDYHLVPGDIINTELGQSDGKAKAAALPKAAAAQPAAPLEPTGKDIGTPLPLAKNSEAGKLPAQQDLWFSFRTPNTNEAGYEFLSYKVELTHKPGYGTIANGVNVELYPYQEQAIWRRGDGDLIKPLGVGGYTTYNETDDTHTWLWDGHLVSNTVYFIRIKNSAPQEIDYDLLIRQR